MSATVTLRRVSSRTLFFREEVARAKIEGGDVVVSTAASSVMIDVRRGERRATYAITAQDLAEAALADFERFGAMKGGAE